jgi:hypothetical protein
MWLPVQLLSLTKESVMRVKNDPTDYAKVWGEKAKALLLHKRIVNVRYLTQEEADDMGWDERTVAFQTHDGLWFFPSRDDEGNGGGALFTSDEKQSCLPVI